MTPQDLIGKTIAEAQIMKRPKYDDMGWLRLTFTDGTKAVIVAGYGIYTGASEDEYPVFVKIENCDEGLIAVE